MERSSRRLYTKTLPNRGLIRPRGPVKSGKPSVHAVLRSGPERAGEHQPWLKAALDVRHHRPDRVSSRPRVVVGRGRARLLRGRDFWHRREFPVTLHLPHPLELRGHVGFHFVQRGHELRMFADRG